jgi:hypothetical protein
MNVSHCQTLMVKPKLCQFADCAINEGICITLLEFYTTRTEYLCPSIKVEIMKAHKEITKLLPSLRLINGSCVHCLLT